MNRITLFSDLLRREFAMSGMRGLRGMNGLRTETLNPDGQHAGSPQVTCSGVLSTVNRR